MLSMLEDESNSFGPTVFTLALQLEKDHRKRSIGQKSNNQI
jgi:hypothetical protein